jgi:hypothetical protein
MLGVKKKVLLLLISVFVVTFAAHAEVGGRITGASRIKAARSYPERRWSSRIQKRAPS